MGFQTKSQTDGSSHQTVPVIHSFDFHGQFAMLCINRLVFPQSDIVMFAAKQMIQDKAQSAHNGLSLLLAERDNITLKEY